MKHNLMSAAASSKSMKPKVSRSPHACDSKIGASKRKDKLGKHKERLLPLSDPVMLSCDCLTNCTTSQPLFLAFSTVEQCLQHYYIFVMFNL